jgi:TPR repeat protein
MSGSVLLHRQRSPQDLQQLVAWYKVRDTLLGQNYAPKDFKKALELAAVCEHPNAVWLTKLFAGRDVNTDAEVREVFLGCKTDPRACSFAAALYLLSWDECGRAADLGDAFAQARMASRTRGEERFRFAEKSAAQGERDAFVMLGFCYQHGEGCEKNVGMAKDCYSIAAELALVEGMCEVGKLFDKSDQQRCFWFGRAAVSGSAFCFLVEMVKQIRTFNSGHGHANVVFAIGRLLKGQIDSEMGTIFAKHAHFDYFRFANQALQFYEFQVESYRKAVVSWTIVGLKVGVVKDIRKMIGKMIWEAREEAKYLKLEKSLLSSELATL